MKHRISTFKNYLQSQMNESSHQILDEMAFRQDVAKTPKLPDSDDREFLSQFDDETIWPDVEQQRWDMLHAAIQDRFKRREPDYQKIKTAVREAIVSKDMEKLKEFSPELQRDVPAWVKSVHQAAGTVAGGDEEKHQKALERAANDAAKELAYYEVERLHPHILDAKDDGLDDGERKFVIKKKGRHGGESKTYVAKPFLNRMLHKLERTRGEPHLPGSGLEGTTGKYGFDMFDPMPGYKHSARVPKRDEFASDEEYKKARQKAYDSKIDRPATTAGLSFPTRKLLGKKLSMFMAHNAHQMFGDLPKGEVIARGNDEVTTRDADGNEYVWKQLPKSFKSDAHVVDTIKKELISKWKGILSSNPEPGSIQLDGEDVPVQDLVKAATQNKYAIKLANQELIQLAEAGELRTPPNPVHPEGVPVELSIGANGAISTKMAPIYLPYKKMKYRVMENGKVVEKEGITPVVRDAIFVRKLYGDEKHDEEIDQSRLRGHDKSYYEMDPPNPDKSPDDPHNPNEFVKGSPGHISGSGLSTNQNTGGRQKLHGLDPRYQELWNTIDSDMGRVSLNNWNKPKKDPNGKYHGDIIEGIWQCLNSPSCGGATNADLEVLKGKVHDMHAMIVMRMRDNLRDPKMQTTKGRRAFAHKITSNYAQQDQGRGGGTRKKRILDPSLRTRSMDQTAGENQDMGVQDAISSSMADGGTVARRSEVGDRARGEKSLPTGRHEWTYDLDNFRRWLKHIAGEAAEADKAKSMSQDAISSMAADIFQKGLDGDVVVTARLKVLAKQVFLAMGDDENEAEKKSNGKIAQWTQGQPSTSDLVARFQGDSEMMDFINQKVKQSDLEQEKAGRLTAAQKQDVDEFRKFIQDNGLDKKLADPATRKMVEKQLQTYVQSRYEDNEFVQAELDAMLQGVSGEAPQAAAAKVVAPQAPGVQDDQAMIKDLLASQKWYEAAMNRVFRARAPLGWLQGVAKKLEAEQATNPDERQKVLNQFALAQLQKVIQQRMAKREQ